MWLFFIIFFVLFLSLSCRDPFFLQDLDEHIIPQGMGTFTLLNSSRTIMPEMTSSLDQFPAFELRFVSNAVDISFNRTYTDLTLPIELITGTYELTVTAFMDSARTQPAAQGTLGPFPINEGANYNGSVTLRPITTGGTGTYSWDITYPTSVHAVNMLVTPIGGSDTYYQLHGGSPATGSSTATRAWGELTLPSGYYRVEFILESSANGMRDIEWLEALHVYRSWESKFEHDFTSDYFIYDIHTVTLNYNYTGAPANGEQSVLHHNFITATAATSPSRSGHTFGGWFTDSACTAGNEWDLASDRVLNNMTLFAKWTASDTVTVTVSGTTTGYPDLQTALGMVDSDGVLHEIRLYADQTISGQDPGAGTVFSLIGVGGERTITLSANMAMFYIDGAGASMTLGENITLIGRNNNNTALVSVSGGGSLTMQTGSKITGNINSSNDNFGGAVALGNNSTFNMTGGTISGNRHNRFWGEGKGGGVFMEAGAQTATFTMSGNARIENNSTNISDGDQGGGVYVGHNSIFTMSGSAVIDGNQSDFGGGVIIDGGTFNMQGGTISNNTVANGSSQFGGGVLVYTNGTFNMSGNALLSGNDYEAVQIYDVGEFNMSGGSITGNYNGVGISPNGEFNMSGGSVTGNTLNDVYVSYGAIRMSGTSRIGNLNLLAESTNAFTPLIIGTGGFSGSGGVDTLNLRGSGMTVTMPTFIGWWENKWILEGSSSLDVSEAVSRIGLGEFIFTGTQPIADTHYIGTTGANIGRLLPLAVTVTTGTAPNEVVTPYASLSAALTTLTSGVTYTVTVYTDQTIEPYTIPTGAKITLVGATSVRTINLSSVGSMFHVEGTGTELTLGNNITLIGRSGLIDNDTYALINVNGTLTMQAGSTVTGNSSENGAGVYVGIGTFTMQGGTISNNTGHGGNGGGVTVAGGNFIMEGGTITGNTAPVGGGGGGGVYLVGGTFTMRGGTITNNTVDDSGYSNGGGGVYIGGGTFIMEGGTITGNTGVRGSDVYGNSGASNLTISGASRIGNLTLSTGGSTLGSFTIGASGFSGTGGITTLDLFSYIIPVSPISAVIERWEGETVVLNASADAVSRIGLGNFIGFSVTPQPITNTHYIANSGTDIGKLLKKQGSTGAFNITMAQITDVNITTIGNVEVSRSAGDSHEFTAPLGLGPYTWKLGTMTIGNTNSITLNAANYEVANYQLTLEVWVDGVPYTKRVTFRVVP